MAADVIDYRIEGDHAPLLTVTLDPGEAVQAEAGAMVMMDQGIRMTTELTGGLLGGLFRKFSGESLFLTYFINEADERQDVCFAGSMPGQIRPIDLSKNGGLFYCQRDAYLCSARGVDVSIALTRKLGAGFFGGEGLILQKLEGDGFAFLNAGGTLVERELGEGQRITVDTGCLVGFSGTCDYDIAFQKGIRNLVFGGEGIFVTHVTGPGHVIVQTQPIAELAMSLARLMPKEEK
ncbi:MAG: TIGR00266 family protein [Nisaea sp.]|jgi:uncharacterized protein (TIGR00266 family)|uniref:TIGR00266 family protein n=1 Tax=Nisaea sp. TaxID=2024842 RepID=UPI001B13178A|nr:TIGR00266 family protein [Nisaea sp.]MBO6560301.1 TIGR00266 family protein [Nisaea sp.]